MLDAVNTAFISMRALFGSGLRSRGFQSASALSAHSSNLPWK
jgi:hypothetical protein